MIYLRPKGSTMCDFIIIKDQKNMFYFVSSILFNGVLRI